MCTGCVCMCVCVCVCACAEQSICSCYSSSSSSSSSSSCCCCCCCSLMIGKVKVVVAYIATSAPTNATEQRETCITYEHLAVGTAGAYAAHTLGQRTMSPTATWTPTGHILTSTPQLTSLAALEDASQRLAPKEALRFGFAIGRRHRWWWWCRWQLLIDGNGKSNILHTIHIFGVLRCPCWRCGRCSHAGHGMVDRMWLWCGRC